MKRTLLLAALVFVLAGIPVIAQSGYVRGQTAEAYAYTHGGYVGKATVQVLSNGSLDVEIDEAFLPHTLAIVDLESSDWSENNTVTYESHGPKHAAKYVEYDGTVYVGTAVGGRLVYVEADESGKPVGAQDLELEILRDQETMAEYYENIQNGRFKVLTRFGGEATAVTETSYGGVTKANSPGYWSFGQTWQGNIDAIEKFIEEYGAEYSRSEMERAEEENADGLKLWSVADTVSGATNSDFPQYFQLVQAALGQLKMR